MRKVFVLLAVSALGLASCTQNSMAKNWGGTLTIDVPKGEKVVVTTWKDSDFWYLTEPMDSGYVPKTKIFREKSTYGINEGTIILKESK